MSIVAQQQRRFAVDEYYAMANTGILGADERVELLEGLIVPMSPIGARHAACVMHVAPAALADLSLPVSQVLAE